MGELTESVRDVVDLLALGEPLGLDALDSLTEPGAVEDAEQRGLVRIVHEPRLAARLAHPLYGEVRRAEIGQLRARRLRGLIATALAVKARRPSRSGVRCWPWNPISAPTQDRCSRQPTRPSGCSISPWGSGWPAAAADAGAGFDARLTQAMALSWLSRGDEAEGILAGLADSAPNEMMSALVTGARLGNLFWTLRRTDEAERLLASELERAEGPTHALLHRFPRSLRRLARPPSPGARRRARVPGRARAARHRGPPGRLRCGRRQAPS